MGTSVDIDGDNFAIGAAIFSKAYSGSLSSVTTLDDGTSKLISGLSFRSNVDWIIGENNSGNKVTLSAGDSADLATAGKSVYIGKNAGSGNNELIILPQKAELRDQILLCIETRQLCGCRVSYFCHDVRRLDYDHIYYDIGRRFAHRYHFQRYTVGSWRRSG
jgi:hypothetical protein